MLDLSLSEILVVVVACLILFKPEDIPQILKQCGKAFRKFKKMANDITSAIKLEDDEAVIKPKHKVLGLDGKYHDAYDVNEVFKQPQPEKEEVSKDGQQ